MLIKIKLFLLSALLSHLCSGQNIRTKVKKYNIVWLVAEDMSPHIPSYGDSTISTPNIDRLVRDGIRFTNVTSTAPVCAPSRSSIITGMYQQTIGTHHMRTSSASRVVPPQTQILKDYEAVLPPNVKCFPEYLRQAGYYCTNNDKTDYQFIAPVTTWDENSKNAHWKNRPKGSPFFAVFNFGITHESQVFPNSDAIKNFPMICDVTKVKLPPFYPVTETARKVVAQNYSNIHHMDAQIGRLIKELEDAGELDNTIIFFYSDHGSGLPYFKRELYHRGVHVPLVVRYPDRRDAGSVNEELISFVDFAPTVLSLFNLPVPDYIQGRVFLGERKGKPRTFNYTASDRFDEHYDMQRGVLDKQFNYIRNYHPQKPNYKDVGYRRKNELMLEWLQLDTAGKLNTVQQRWFQKNKSVEELYDYLKDPWELNNLANDPAYKEVLQKFRKAHADFEVEAGDWGLVPEYQMVQLWWKGNEQPVTKKPFLNRKGNIVAITCDDDGASIGYKKHKNDHWKVYHAPVTISPDDSLYIITHRIGYQPSELLKVKF